MPFPVTSLLPLPGQNDASAIQSEVANTQSWRPAERYAVHFLTSDFVHEMGSRLRYEVAPCAKAKLLDYDLWLFLFRSSPERIFECFLEVAAPTDCEGRYSTHFNLNLQLFDSMRKIKSNELHALTDTFIWYYLLLKLIRKLSNKTCRSPYEVDHLEGNSM